MDKDEIRQFKISLHSILGHVTTLLHTLQEIEEHEPNQPPRVMQIPASVSKHISPKHTKKAYRTRSTSTPVYDYVRDALARGPKKWRELIQAGEARGATRFMVSSVITKLRERGVIHRVHVDGANKWALVKKDAEPIQASDDS